jgi:sigma-B regulation protein RsbU (phosphoserine phosphatase)
MIPTTFEERTFPTVRPVIPGLDYFGDWRPASGVSADYIDYFKMNDGNLGLAVGDVRGKGVPPALLKSSLHSMLRALRCARNFSLKAFMRTIDKLFSEISPDNCYASLFVGEYDPSNGRLHYVNAGHEPPFVLRKNGAHFQTDFLEPGGPVIGLLRESPFRDGVVSLKPGDVLVAYTDGLCETTNHAGEEWGWPRFLKTVEDCADQHARDIVEGVMQTAEAFAGGAPPHDDATLFVGRVQDAIAGTPHWDAECVVPVAA